MTKYIFALFLTFALLRAEGAEPVRIFFASELNTQQTTKIPWLINTGEIIPEAKPDYSKSQGLPKGVFMGASGIFDFSKAGVVPLREMPEFQNMIKIVKAAGINTIMFSPKNRERTEVIWKSKYLRSMETPGSLPEYDMLKEFCDAVRSEGLKSEIYMVENDPYFGDEYAYNNYRNKVECIWDFRDKWSNVLREMAGYNLDGMCVVPDEFFAGHRSTPGKDDPCTAKFREWYDYDPPNPKELGDNIVSRKWIDYGYRAMGEVFSTWNDLVRKTNPGIIRTNVLSVARFAFNKRECISYDVLGHAADFDYMMTDPNVGLHLNLRDHYVAEVVKHLEGSSPSRRSMVTIQGSLEKYDPDVGGVWVYGVAISALAAGTDGIYFWNYGDFKSDSNEFKNVEITFNTMRTLERWGIKEATVPTQVALLYSQRSEDYADLIKDKVMGNGYEAQEKGNDLLLANGYPYRLYYLEQEADWKNVDGLKVIVLPFAYVISDKAIAQLEDHLRAGRKLVILQRMGEADENGELRPEPGLKRLAKAYPKQVFNVPGEVFAGSTNPEYINHFISAMNNALGKERLLFLNRYGYDAEVSALQLPDGKLMLFAINWEPDDISIEVGVNMPNGTYHLTERNLEGIQPVSIGNQTTLNAGDLKHFAVSLKKDEFKIWLVEPAK